MSFIHHPGLNGKVYLPYPSKCGQKHRCADCFACQRCSKDRCQICLGRTPTATDTTEKRESMRHGNGTPHVCHLPQAPKVI